MAATGNYYAAQVAGSPPPETAVYRTGQEATNQGTFGSEASADRGSDYGTADQQLEQNRFIVGFKSEPWTEFAESRGSSYVPSFTALPYCPGIQIGPTRLELKKGALPALDPVLR